MKMKRTKRIALPLLIVCVMLMNVASFAASTIWLDEHYWTTSSIVVTRWNNYYDQKERVENLQDELNDLKSSLRDHEDELDDLGFSIIGDVAFIAGYSIMFASGDTAAILGLGENAYALYLDVRDRGNCSAEIDSLLEQVQNVSRELANELEELADLHEILWDSTDIHYAP